MADQLSRTLEYNRYRLHHSVMMRTKLHFDFDLFGSPIHSLASKYCTSLTYRARKLRDCPPLPSVSVACPPWNQALPLLSEALGDQGRIKGRILLILPEWPAQPWWPLLLRVAQGKLLTFGSRPWVSPAGVRPLYGARGVWIGQ